MRGGVVAMLVCLSAYSAGARAEFKDCKVCPVMVTLPAGEYVKGPREDEPGRAPGEVQARVRIGYRFAIGKFDVTRAEFLAFASATHYVTSGGGCWGEQAGGWGQSAERSWSSPGFDQTPTDPVVCVTWNDARAYAAWLSKLTGREYRLPTNDEWEYAARAGTDTIRPWGDAASHEFANYGQESCCGGRVSGRDRWLHTSPAGSFPPNRFGLYDMMGNVGQWVQDCGADCTQRQRRGGGWIEQSQNLRVAWSFAIEADHSSSDGGFRVVTGAL
ncbi:MAG TPA: SUMF1/EgtB/PvdO family nonheme iron enzyme [Steroidobacteraceae bacterium]|nr:SUMF1/EgtB/PvdO family nonheme iron enzyme [Steroidobacteraceae bacterium]